METLEDWQRSVMSVSGLRISDPEACLRGQDRGRRKISLKEWVQRNCAGGILANNNPYKM